MRWFLVLVAVLLVLAIAFAIAVLMHAQELREREAASAASGLAAQVPTAPVPGIETDDNDPVGQPVSRTRPLQILHKHYFTVGYDNASKEPAWVSYHLAGSIRFHGKEHRPEKFTTDPEVQSPAHHEDYTRSGYDRGHLCPAFAIFSRFGRRR